MVGPLDRRRHPDADRNSEPFAARRRCERLLRDRQAEPLGDRPCAGYIGLRHHDDKFVATLAVQSRDEIDAPHVLLSPGREFP